jgi:hypothetical protein
MPRYLGLITTAPSARWGFSPLDRQLRLRRDSWSEGLVRESARLGTTQPSFKVAAETRGRVGRIDISSTTVWRHHDEVASKVETELEREEQEVPIDVLWQDVAAMEWILSQSPIEEHASVSIDGAMILIRDDGYREVKVVSVSEVTLEPEEENVSQIDKKTTENQANGNTKEDSRGRQDGLKLTNHSYRAILGDKAAFVPALKGELARRRVKQAPEISAVSDGAGWIWNLTAKYLPERCVGILDWSHGLENLAKAAKAGFGEGTKEAHLWMEQRETELWNGERVQVETSLRELPRRRGERGKAIRQVKEYIDEHWQRIDYARFRDEGRPVGSGTVESGAKNVVQWRMKRGGQRWSRAGATRMLAALGEVHSARWDATLARLPKAV